MKHDEILLHDLKDELAYEMTKLTKLDQFLIEHEKGIEYEQKRLLRVQRSIQFSLCSVLQARIEEIESK